MRPSKPCASVQARAERAASAGRGAGAFRPRFARDGAVALALACAALAAGAAQAQCAAPAERSIAIDAAIVVPRDRAAGSVLYAADYPLPAPGCMDPARGGGWRYAQTPHPSQSQDLYRTGVAAVGLRLSIDGRPLATAEYADAAPVAAGDGRASLRLELVKIDEAGSGGAVRGAELPTLVYRSESDASTVAARVAFTGAIAVRAATCSTPSVRVALDPVAPAALPRIGASAGAKNFELRLNDCPPGLTRISYRLDPLGAADLGAATVALDPGASARGLAVQIRERDGRPLAFGVNHRIDAEGLSDGGNFRVPLQAAYYRDGARTPSPGTVAASLTFTLSYE